MEAVLEIIAWPVVVFVLIVFTLVLFRKTISDGLKEASDGLKEGKVEWGTGANSIWFRFFDKIEQAQTLSESEITDAESPTPTTDIAGHWEKPGTLFWLAVDLMFTANTLHQLTPAGSTVRGFKQAIHHLQEIGDPELHATIEKLRSLLQRFQKEHETLTQEERGEIAGGVLNEVIGIGGLATARQPGYKPKSSDL